MATKTKKVAFLFGEGGSASPAVLGGKGAGLSELARLAVPVPPGFTVTTTVARAFAQHGRLPRRLQQQLGWNIAAVEHETGKVFGSAENPLLVSVRSGARVSMPGMLDTVLNLGLNPKIAQGLAKLSGGRFAYDCYRRFLQMFGNVVLGIDAEQFEEILAIVKYRRGVATDQELTVGALQEICNRFRALIEERTGKPVVDDPHEQLNLAIIAVLKSWNNPRAKAYRQVNGIPNDLGTAVNVQSMVYGNLDEDSCSGVVFSRNVTTGEPGLWGEFLINAQGEDVVSGARTPTPIGMLSAWNRTAYEQLESIVLMLSARGNAVMDVEFTIESGVLWILQHRKAKLTPEAAATVAVHMEWAGQLTKEEALASVTDEQVALLQARGFDPAELELAKTRRLLAKGLPASHGAVVGKVVTSSQAAVEAAARGETVVLVRHDTSPNDLPGMLAAAAFVTGTGGKTSHAAVVARSLGKAAVVGCGSLFIRPITENMTFEHGKFKQHQDDHWLASLEGQTVSVDGRSGVVILGAVKLADLTQKKEVNIFLRWVDQAEAKKWPKQRLAFETFQQSVTAFQVVADFYLTEHMALEARHTPLGSSAQRIRTAVHTAVAEKLAMYLVVAVGGEIRHGDSWWENCRDELKILISKFKIQLSGNRGDAQRAAIKQLKIMTPKEHLQFLELLATVFDNGQWTGAVGGKRWGSIARAAYKFLNGELGHSEFADHAFDLQHNGGTVFGKNPMLMCDPDPASGERRLMQNMLDAKKYAKSASELYQKLHRLKPDLVLSSQVRALYQQGCRLGLWKVS